MEGITFTVTVRSPDVSRCIVCHNRLRGVGRRCSCQKDYCSAACQRAHFESQLSRLPHKKHHGPLIERMMSEIEEEVNFAIKKRHEREMEELYRRSMFESILEARRTQERSWHTEERERQKEKNKEILSGAPETEVPQKKMLCIFWRKGTCDLKEDCAFSHTL